jgi:hypothetical protein
VGGAWIASCASCATGPGRGSASRCEPGSRVARRRSWQPRRAASAAAVRLMVATTWLVS